MGQTASPGRGDGVTEAEGQAVSPEGSGAAREDDGVDGAARPARRVTIWDVAAEAGVSQNTVSLILKGSPRISAVTRARVHAVMERLGYQPNAVAAALRSRTTRAVLFATPLSHVHSHLNSELVAGITDEAAASDYCLVVQPVGENASRIVELYRSQQISAAVVFPRGMDDPSALALVSAGCPTVAVLSPSSALGPDRQVMADDTGGAAAAVSHLVERGHRRIGLVAPPGPDWGIAMARVRGARAAARQAGATLTEAWSEDWGVGDGYRAAGALWAGRRPPTAVFAISDRLAYGVLQAAGERGFHVPGDLAVVGFDNLEWSAYSQPPLTTVEFPIYAMGREAARRLLRADESPAWERAPAALVVRRSS